MDSTHTCTTHSTTKRIRAIWSITILPIYIYNNRWSREKLKLQFQIRTLILWHVSKLQFQIKTLISCHLSFLHLSKIKWDQISLCSFFFWVNKTFCSLHPRIFRFNSPTIIKTQNPSSPSMYNSPLLQLTLWNFKRISRYQWCMPLGISISYIGRGSPSIPIVLFFILPKVWLLLSFSICFPSFLWISKLKHPQKNKKLNIREM